jgi:iron complex transport system substrate-binding protein
MAPSITETVYALGLQDRLVGVTRFCAYPAEARTKRDVGGYLDPNYEVLLGLRPDLVLLLPEHGDLAADLSGQGFATMTVNQRTVAGILASIRRIAEVCGEDERGENLAGSLARRMEGVAARTAGLPAPETLVVIGRDVSAGRVGEVYICGPGGWYVVLLAMAGGRNAYQGEALFPVVSAEGVMEMAPEVILEMFGTAAGEGRSPADVARAWQSLPQVPAVASGRVHPFLDDFAVTPGPRFILILEKMARVLHPGLEVGGQP